MYSWEFAQMIGGGTAAPAVPSAGVVIFNAQRASGNAVFAAQR